VSVIKERERERERERFRKYIIPKYKNKNIS